MDYKNAKIYALRSHQTELIYIGSTASTLVKRFYHHKHKNNICTAREILKYADAYIELLEAFPCGSKIELHKREGELIRTNNCVNKNIAGRTLCEYNADNKEQKAETHAKYYAEHKEKIAERRAKYYAEHKEQYAERQAKYRAKKKTI